MTFEQLHRLLVNDCHMEVSDSETYYNEHMEPGSRKYEIFKSYRDGTGTYNATGLFMIITKREKSEPFVILVCPAGVLKCVKLDDIEAGDVMALYGLRNTVIRKQAELDRANLDLLNFKEKMWLKSRSV